MPSVTPLSRRRFLRSAGVTAAAGCAASAVLAADAPSPKKPQTHKYEELLPEEFYEEFERAPIIYWATGAMEEHGLHNPMGTDFYQGYEVCRRAVEISGGILFPPLPIGPAAKLSHSELRSGTQRLYPPSLWTSRELCKQLYIELLESMADLKFKVCLAFGGHAPCDWILQEIHKEMNGQIRGMRFWGGGQSILMADAMRNEYKRHPLGSGHGMMLETSLIAASHPNLIDLPRAKRIKDNPLDSQLKVNSRERLDYIANANAETGNLQLNAMSQSLAQLAREMLAGYGGTAGSPSASK
ncbi:MAG: creatininase family protein [Kiritimatiellae bacterium]|nr:creatininase family protein [Kiritimatiellia bacterium]